MARAPAALPALAVAAAALAACGPDRPPVLTIPEPTPKGLEAVRALDAPFNAGDPAAGRQAFVLCIDCHDFTPEGMPGQGPGLQDIFGAPAAAKSNWVYSDALRASGFVWDARRLDGWIFNPHEALPGTTMGFIGIRSDEKRRNLIAYLAAVSAK